MIVTGASQVLTMPADRGPARSTPEDVGCVQDAAVVIDGDRVAWVGPQAELSAVIEMPSRARRVDATGCVVLPGLVDPHTHVVFAGDRADEFHRRNAGATYAEIAAAGGGIASTVRATRAASDEELIAAATLRLHRFLAQGVTTVEAKSGYGLDPGSERRILEVIRALNDAQAVDLVPTFLGAHVVPPEFKADVAGPEGRTAYLDLVCGKMIPEIARAGLAEFCDVFCDDGAFTVAESRRVLAAGYNHGLTPRIHAEQFTSCGGAALAAELGCASVDHLEAITPEDIARLASARLASDGRMSDDSPTPPVAVILPGVSLFLGLTRFAPARALIDAGVPVAVGTDCNPGTAHSENIWLAVTLACTYGKLTPEEALAAVTVEAARSLHRPLIGTLTPGAQADLAIIEASSYRWLPYHMAMNNVRAVIKDGLPIRNLHA